MMGMFDSIYIDIKCPYCKETSLIECQTKELACVLDIWHKGDSIETEQFNYLNCTADCLSKDCVEWQDKKCGYHSGFGRMFPVLVMLDNGIITGNYEILKNNQ